MLTGHGCFGEYLGRNGREATTPRYHCDKQWDTACHTLEERPAWVRLGPGREGYLSGPGDCPRRLYVGVVQAIMMYGAPVWADALATDKTSQRALANVMCGVATRAIRGYCTISCAAAGVLAGIPLVEYVAKARADMYTATARIRDAGGITTEREKEALRRRAKQAQLFRWARLLSEPNTAGSWTVRAILPHLESWVDRKWGGATYRMT